VVQADDEEVVLELHGRELRGAPEEVLRQLAEGA